MVRTLFSNSFYLVFLVIAIGSGVLYGAMQCAIFSASFRSFVERMV